MNRIALFAPHASINIVHNYSVVEKLEVKLPKAIEGIIKCVNPCCVSNSNEPVPSRFYVKNEEPLTLRCHYCGIIMEHKTFCNNFNAAVNPVAPEPTQKVF